MGSGHAENHRLNGERGNRTRTVKGVPVKKSYVRRNLLSTENATELPKCSKSLHFRRIDGAEERLCDGE